MRASIRQVAELAQVSPITVSRVLRGRKGMLREETYNRVMAALKELDYVYVHTNTQRHAVETNVIGIVPAHRRLAHQSLDGMTFEGIGGTASEHDYDLFIMLRSEAEWMANREELRFLDRRSDGFIFISPNMGEWRTSLEALVKHDIPTVVCYRRDVPAGVAWVDPDNETIIRLSIEHLEKHGHTNIAYLGAPSHHLTSPGTLANLSSSGTNYDDMERQHYFQQLMRERHGQEFEPLTVHIASTGWQVGEAQLQTVREAGVTGVVCVNDLIALRLWDTAEAAGLAVPTDLSIISVDNKLQAAHRGLTSIGFGYAQVGALAVKAWLQLRQGKKAEECCAVVPVKLEDRSSVGPPRH